MCKDFHLTPEDQALLAEWMYTAIEITQDNLTYSGTSEINIWEKEYQQELLERARRLHMLFAPNKALPGRGNLK